MYRLDVISIEGKGDLDNECVWLDVKEDIADLSYYLIFDTTYTDNEHISNELRHTYWFARRSVSRGDYIKLMTKKGVYSTSGNKRNTTTHVLYWGLDRTVWNKDGDCAVFFKCESWKTKRANVSISPRNRMISI